jgi:hypothetical protein
MHRFQRSRWVMWNTTLAVCLSLLWSSWAMALPGLTTTGSLGPPANYESFTVTSGGFPAVNSSYTDPVFGTQVWRVTNHYPDDGDSLLHNKNQNWNADGTVYLHNAPGSVNLINPSTGATIRTGVPWANDAAEEASFDPVLPDVYYYLDGTANLRQYAVGAGTTSTLKTFGSTLAAVGGTTDWIDRTGRYFLLNIAGVGRVWDKQTDTLYSGTISMTGITGSTGWAGISPDGNYIIRSISTGNWSHAINHTTDTVDSTGIMFWNVCFDHGDVMSASDGKTYMITGACLLERWHYRVDVSIDQAGRSTTLQAADNQRLFPSDASGVTGNSHYSCASHGANQDWCMASIEDTGDTIGSPGTWYAYKNELVFAHMVAPFEVYRLVHHRSRPPNSFCRTPRSSLNWQGTVVLFSSNMSVTGSGVGCAYSDLYRIELNAASGPVAPAAPTNLRIVSP